MGINNGNSPHREVLRRGTKAAGPVTSPQEVHSGFCWPLWSPWLGGKRQIELWLPRFLHWGLITVDFLGQKEQVSLLGFLCRPCPIYRAGCSLCILWGAPIERGAAVGNREAWFGDSDGSLNWQSLNLLSRTATTVATSQGYGGQEWHMEYFSRSRRQGRSMIAVITILKEPGIRFIFRPSPVQPAAQNTVWRAR